MRSSVDGPPNSRGNGVTGNNNNNNNNNRSNNSENSGSQYALCALGVGLIALGIVMIVWSVVPAEASSNSSSSSSGGGGGGGGDFDVDNRPNKRNKVSSVAFVLVGAGVIMLLLSLCLGLRNKRREQQSLREAQSQRGVAADGQDEAETAEQQAQRFAVPSYEEAVGSGQYPVRQSNPRPSSSQLPSYDDLIQVDGVQIEFEGSEVTSAVSQPGATSTSATASASNRRPGRNSRKLNPLKIRRIKSEKLQMKNVDNSQPAGGFSVEPLTPPPQYEDKVPPI